MAGVAAREYAVERGPSIVEMMRARLIEGGSEDYLLGLATGLAILLNPYNPDPAAVMAERSLI